MNRSTIGDILKQYGMELYHFTRKNRNTYHVYRKPNRWNDCILITPFVTVKNIQDIYLCTNEILITGIGNMEVNIPYIFLDEFEIRGFEE